ncbi:MAG: hypothetical protein K6F35_11640 [Lachnospiraceae bacterium]|nr:hypothetical protein [Lachnospiraceae bacterium]
MVYKCSSCGSCMIYDFKEKTLTCPSCSQSNPPEPVSDNLDDVEICPVCGGSLSLGRYGTAVKCGYCDSFNVIASRLSGEAEPSAIVPTFMSRKHMFELLREKFSRYLCIIPEAFSESRLKEVIIEYVPYWVYHFGIRASFNGEIRTSKTTGNTTVTDTYAVRIVTDLGLSNVPVDASDLMPDEIMDDLEPFDLKTALPFKIEQLSGSNSERFNHDAEFYKEEAACKASSQAYDYIYEDLMKRYPHATNLSERTIRDHTDLNITTLDIRYFLLPVYKYSYTFHSGRVLDYYVNGQTEEVWGTAPISKPRLILAVAATILLFSGVASIVTTILMAIGGAL